MKYNGNQCFGIYIQELSKMGNRFYPSPDYSILFLYTSRTKNAFPGAIGFGAASGGRGGQVIYVTNLNINVGIGLFTGRTQSSRDSVHTFKVAGGHYGTVEVPNGNGNFTSAGQTSPGGITVRGFQMYNNDNPSVNNVIIRHLRSRMGDINLHPTGNWLGGDGITIGGVQNAIMYHCSFQHAVDEYRYLSIFQPDNSELCAGETPRRPWLFGGMLINYSDAQSPFE